MSRAIAARRSGDEYQARVFWGYLLELRIDNIVESVILESDRISFVDDIVVKYREPILERATGKKYLCDFLQCKYHVTQVGSFNTENLIDPAFINSKNSMLKRLYDAYVRLSQNGLPFRLVIMSSWFWHPDDELAVHLSTEGFIRQSFFEGGLKSKTGEIRSKFMNHLSINEHELQTFLDTIRFSLGKNLNDLAKNLKPCLKLAGLKPIDLTSSSIIYDDLTWKLFEQGKNHFDRASFDQMIKEENLIEYIPPNYSEISICSFSIGARRPHDLQSGHLDLLKYFEGRFPRSQDHWKKEIPEEINAFLDIEWLKRLPQPIHLFFDCHLTIAFYTGHLMNPKYGVQIVPMQKSIITGYESWDIPKNFPETDLWKIDISGNIDTEAIVAISVTNPIEQHLSVYLESSDIKEVPTIYLSPLRRMGQNVISDGTYAWHLGFELKKILRQLIPSTCEKIHLFFSAPVALAYIFGNNLQYIAKKLQMYEHDYEGLTEGVKYYKSIEISFNNKS